MVRTLTLWTECGAARHAKMLNSDKAWEMFELLEETFFRVKDTAPVPALPQSYAEALRALADTVEEKERIAHERDEAIRTKSWISDKKTATALGKVGGLTSANNKLRLENADLKDKLGESDKWFLVRNLTWLDEFFVKKRDNRFWSQLGWEFTKIRNKLGQPVRKLKTIEYHDQNVHTAVTVNAVYEHFKNREPLYMKTLYGYLIDPYTEEEKTGTR